MRGRSQVRCSTSSPTTLRLVVWCPHPVETTHPARALTEEIGRSTPIASVSLGAPRRFLLRGMTKREDNAAITLANGSLTIMENECQHRYVHCIPREQDVADGRINLTFRCKHKVHSNSSLPLSRPGELSPPPSHTLLALERLPQPPLTLTLRCWSGSGDRWRAAARGKPQPCAGQSESHEPGGLVDDPWAGGGR